MIEYTKYLKSSEESRESYVTGWNWGAFLLTWIWGIGNRVPSALLFNAAITGPYEAFILGKYRNRLAWNNGWWRDFEHFKRTQRRWTYVGFIIYLIPLLTAFIGYIFVQILLD